MIVQKLELMISNLSSANVEDKVLQILQDNQPFIADLNIDQLQHGQAPDGGPIGEYRNPLYERFKKNKNPKAGGKVDLILTGDFTDKFYVDAKSFPVTIDSTDYKTPLLTEKYDRDKIFGLQPGNKAILSEHIKEEFQDWLAGLLNIQGDNP